MTISPARRLPAVLALLLAAVPGLALAQGSAAIIGTIVDTQTKKPIADAVVVATSPSLQGEQTALTDATGNYRISQLSPGVYQLNVTAEGYHPLVQKDAELRPDHTVRANLEMLAESAVIVGDEITVIGKPAVVDVTSSTQSYNVSQAFMQNIPVSRPGGIGGSAQSFESLALVAPQTAVDFYGVSINGASSPENSYRVDGLSVNDPGYGINGTPLAAAFIDDVEVITGGYMPEYGRTTAGAISATTKSGGNEFHGSVYFDYSPGFMGGTAKTVTSTNTVIGSQLQPYNILDFGAQLGGYIVKDRLWFFAGIQPSGSRYSIERSINALVPSDPGDPNSPVTPTTIPGATKQYFADERSVQYIAKLTFLINDDNRISAAVYGTPTWSGGGNSYPFLTQGFGPSPILFPVTGSFTSTSGKNTNDALDLTVRYTGAYLERKVLLDVGVGWHHQSVDNLPVDGSGAASMQGLAGQPLVVWGQTDPQPHTLLEFEPLTPEQAAMCGPLGSYCPATNYTTGGPGFTQETTFDSYQFKPVLSLLFTWLGHHVSKVGADVDYTTYSHVKAYTGGFLLQEDSGGTVFFDARQYGRLDSPDNPVFLNSIAANSSSLIWGFFLQDSWSVMDKVTVNLGIRYDSQTLYNGAGQPGIYLPNQWSPRIGVVWDPTQQGKSKIYGSFARYYESVPLDIADRGLTGEPALIAGHICNALTNSPGCRNANTRILLDPTSPNTQFFVTGADRTPVDPALQAQSSDEWLVGAEYEVLTNFRIGVVYTHRQFHQVIEDMSRDNGATYFIGNPGSGIATDFPVAQRTYQAVTVTVNKSFADNWLLQASYTWSQLTGNYDGLFRPETAQLDPNANSTFDLRQLLANQDGPLSGDTTNVIKAYGAKVFPIGAPVSITLGAAYQGASGVPINYLGANRAQQYGPGEVYILPRGSGGRQPWVNTVDLRLAVDWHISKTWNLSVSVDCFNVFNFQQITAVDNNYTFAGVLPVVNGKPSDLPSTLRYDDGSGRPFAQADINPNFQKALAYQLPRAFRFGVKLTF